MGNYEKFIEYIMEHNSTPTIDTFRGDIMRDMDVAKVLHHYKLFGEGSYVFLGDKVIVRGENITEYGISDILTKLSEFVAKEKSWYQQLINVLEDLSKRTLGV
jgi:hypothetical protein